MHKIAEMYISDPSKTAKEIAELSGLSRARVYQVLNEYGFKAAPGKTQNGHTPRAFAHSDRVMRDGKRMTSSFIGEMSEIIAAHDLMSRGFYVYRSLNNGSPFDLVAYSKNSDEPNILRVEVKSGSTGNGGLRHAQPSNKEYDVIAVVELESARVVYKPPLPV